VLEFSFTNQRLSNLSNNSGVCQGNLGRLEKFFSTFGKKRGNQAKNLEMS
jgi:hypothetical protein